MNPGKIQKIILFSEKKPLNIIKSTYKTLNKILTELHLF